MHCKLLILNGVKNIRVGHLDFFDKISSERNQGLRLAVFHVGVGFGLRAKLRTKDSLGQV